MNLNGVSVRLGADEYLKVVFTPAKTTRDELGVWERPETLHVHLGPLHVCGGPRLVIETLGRALTECYAAWGDGGSGDPDDDGPAGPAAALQSAAGPAPHMEQHTNEGGDER